MSWVNSWVCPAPSCRPDSLPCDHLQFGPYLRCRGDPSFLSLHGLTTEGPSASSPPSTPVAWIEWCIPDPDVVDADKYSVPYMYVVRAECQGPDTGSPCRDLGATRSIYDVCFLCLHGRVIAALAFGCGCNLGTHSVS